MHQKILLAQRAKHLSFKLLFSYTPFMKMRLVTFNLFQFERLSYQEKEVQHHA
jgi:hypothetical protein